MTMELEVTKKVREAIKAKLLELGTHIDDELPDYVMILIANRRSVPQMETDLALFLQENSKKFVGWLTHVLKKLEQVTAVSKVPEQQTDSNSSIPAPKVNNLEAEHKKKKPDAKNKTKKLTKGTIKESHKTQHKKHAEKDKGESSSIATKAVDKKHKKKVKKAKVVCEPDTTTISQPKESEPESKIFAPALKKVTSSTTTSSLIGSSQPKVSLTLKKTSVKVKTTKSSFIFGDSEETEKKQSLSILSDDEKVEDKEEPASKPSQSKSVELEPESVSLEEEEEELRLLNQTDTLILEADENEFASVNESANSTNKANKEENFTERAPSAEKVTKDDNTNESAIDNEKEINELRRIALESQSRIRNKNKNLQQKKIIQDILFKNRDSNSSVKEAVSRRKPEFSLEKADSGKDIHSRHKTVSKVEKADSSTAFHERRRKESPKRICRSRSPIQLSPKRIHRSRSPFQQSPIRKERKRSLEKESSSRISGSPKRSIFDRLTHKRERRRSRSRSRSPARKLTSTIGTVINRNNEHETVRPTVSSVVRVTDRPKRDLKANNKLLLLAVADAQKSIIQSEQSLPKVSEARKRKSEQVDQTVITKRRFSELPDAMSKEYYEQDSQVRRQSVKERLGVKRDGYKSIKERLGLMAPKSFAEISDDSYDVYKDDEFSIVVNVNDHTGGTIERRNVTLATTVPELDFSKMNRISIQVNNAGEDDDTSEDDSSSDDDRQRVSKSQPRNERMDHSGASVTDDDGVCVSVDYDDKLPEVPESDNEYLVEEIELDESSQHMDQKGSPKETTLSESTQQVQKISTIVSGVPYEEAEKKAEFTTEENSLNNFGSGMHPLSSTLPDLRGRLGNSVPVAKPIPAASKLKCKFWPSCQFKDSCTFEHPMCRYNTACTNLQCVYRHEKKDDGQKKKVCKFFPKCTSMKCKFVHPSPCRFGIGCTDFKCTNYHPGPTIGMQKLKAKGVTVIPNTYQLQWTKNKV